MPLSERYRLLSRLYDGRAVVVYRARDAGGAPVILKTLKPGAGSAQRLRHEHDILRRLDVPGVVHARALDEAEGEPALVLEDLGGATLAARLAEGPLPLAEALRLAAEVAETPYSALLQALTELVRGLLAEPEEQLAAHRQRIQEAVGGLGSVLTDVLPDLELVIGPQPAAPEVQATESKNRFRRIFERFVHAFSRHGQPLVLFLDDLQWADAATLELLAAVLRGAEAGALLVIGAYRDGEACFAVNHAMYILTLTGRPLPALREACEQGLEFVRKLKHDVSERVIRLHVHAALALQGLTRSPGSFSTDDLDEAAFAAEMAALDYQSELYWFWSCKLMVLYVLGHHEEGLSIAARARKDVHQVLGTLLPVVDHPYFDALLLASLAEKKGGLARGPDLVWIRLHLRRLKRWAESAPTSSQHRYHLVEAELARLTRDDHRAIQSYEKAILLARQGEVLHDEAIASELAGKFFLSRGLSDVAMTYFGRARAAYARWGAHAKVALLDRAYPGLVAGSTDHAGASLSTASSTSSSGAFDFPSLLKASQAISGEIALDKLLLQLMRIVAENAGAERGLLVLVRAGTAAVEAEFTARDGVRLPERPVPVHESPSLPAAIVTFVLRTQKIVLFNDAQTESAFAHDPHIASGKPRAVLCLPLVQKGELQGALYLENNLAAGAFTSERTEFLSVLCAQMAISIENAHLYADLEQKVVERTRELRQAQARGVLLEKEATETQMAGGFAHEMRNALTAAKIRMAVLSAGARSPEKPSALANRVEALTALFLKARERAAGASVVGDEAHVRSILTNLVLNARDALLDVGKGEGRTISLSAHEEPRGFVLSVSDTGVGIHPDLHGKIFDPFFSTKPLTGKGLGLGIVRKLVMRYGGNIEIESAPGQGTTFRVSFPNRFSTRPPPPTLEESA